MLWLLVTSHRQKGESSNASTSQAQIVALERLTLMGEHQLSVIYGADDTQLNNNRIQESSYA